MRMPKRISLSKYISVNMYGYRENERTWIVQSSRSLEMLDLHMNYSKESWSLYDNAAPRIAPVL